MGRNKTPSSLGWPYPTTHRHGSAFTDDLATVDHTWSSGADAQNSNHHYSQTSNRHPQLQQNPDIMPSSQEQHMTIVGALSIASMPDMLSSRTRPVGPSSIPSPPFWGTVANPNSSAWGNQKAMDFDEPLCQFGNVQPPGSDRSGYQGSSCSQSQQELHEYFPDSTLQGSHNGTTDRSARRDQGYGPDQYLTRFDANSVSSSTLVRRRSNSEFNGQTSWPRIVVQDAQGSDWQQQNGATQTLEPSLGYPPRDGIPQTTGSGNMMSSYPQYRIPSLASSLSPSSSTQGSEYWTDEEILEEPISYDESIDGRLSVPRTARRDNRDEDTQRRRRLLTPEGRQHAKEVRKARACQGCHRRKIKCKHVLARDLDANSSVKRAHVGPRASSDSYPSGQSSYDSRLSTSHSMHSLAPTDYSSYNLSRNYLPRGSRNESGIDRYQYS